MAGGIAAGPQRAELLLAPVEQYPERFGRAAAGGAARARDLETDAADRAAVTGVDLSVVRPHVDEGFQALQGIGDVVVPRDQGAKMRALALDHGGGQVVLGAEMIIDAAQRHFRRLGDVGQAGRRHASLVEQIGGGGLEAFPSHRGGFRHARFL